MVCLIVKTMAGPPFKSSQHDMLDSDICRCWKGVGRKAKEVTAFKFELV